MPRKSKAPKKTPKKHPTPRLLLSGDAAASAGVALFLDGKLVAHSPADGTRFKTLWQIVGPMVAPYKDIPPSDRMALIEEGFISFHSVKGSLTLGRRRGLMQAAFEAAGFDTFEFVPATTWQSVIFNHRKVPDTKAASLAYAHARWGMQGVTDDEADAACVAAYWLQERCQG